MTALTYSPTLRSVPLLPGYAGTLFKVEMRMDPEGEYVRRLDHDTLRQASAGLAAAMRELLEAIDTLEDVTHSRGFEPYKAEAVWNDALRRAAAALETATKEAG